MQGSATSGVLSDLALGRAANGACARNDRIGASIIALLLVCLFGATANAADRVWLIGGGYDLDNSQVQIEQNVLWARDTLHALPGERVVRSLFNDGDDPAPDLLQWQKPAEDAANLQPLARVYGEFHWNGEAARSHRIVPIDGPATRAAVLELLGGEIPALRAGEQGLLVYAGHGSPTDTGSRLDLWGGGDFDPADLRDLLGRQPAATTLRFVFTQCFAGGFQDALTPPPASPATAGQCAFYAAARDRPAEGCSTGLEVTDYRGYGSYFFAALAGRARDGGALITEPDRNGDGRVDPYEAHLYTLRAARSTDLPRSSSEQFLLDWAPWYLPLLRVTVRADNPYAAIAAALAADLGLPDAARPTVHAHRKAVQQQIRRQVYRQEQARSRAEGLMEHLQAELEQRWPQARYPHTRAYRDFLHTQLNDAQTFIAAHPRYPQLVRDQDDYVTFDNAVVELQRRSAQLDRIELLLHLARVRDALLTRAGAAERMRYRQLLECEKLPL